MQALKTVLLSLMALGLINFNLSGQYNFTFSATEGCTPFKVKYTFTSSATIDTIDSFYWDFGDGMTSTEENPDTVVYNNPGTYTPVLVLNNNPNLTISKPDLIIVHRTVEAYFIYYDTVSYATYVFEHTDVLDEETTYNFLWDFEDVGTRTGQREIITFPRVDTFAVSLTINDDNGCTSTKVQNVIILEEINIQNVFTPNGDNINDFFIVSSKGSYPLHMQIYSRSGILVYENNGYTITWDGRTASGHELETGIYFYTIEAISGDPDNRYNKAGTIYLYK